ncbi:antA/AntB antirepressor family protein [Blautia sp. HCP3S3_G3]|uniref:antA/AntB antirepressor family protein n=1 Tax=Blautia sp. HCP3S3_G3 TaxID=3438913 RepID=UPI003F8C282C
MNDIFNEVFSTPDTSKQTPIEIALGVDEQGMTTATKLYGFLELNPSNYSKWFKKNIIENQFAEENVDYFRFVLKYESGDNFSKERQDARLTASFAKKLSMMQKNQKGEAARNYFVGIENGAKKLTREKVYETKATSLGEIASFNKEMDKRMEKQGSAPWKICEAFKMVSEQFGIRLPDDFVKIPEYEQISFLE